MITKPPTPTSGRRLRLQPRPRSTTAPPASAAGAVDGGWPRAYTTNSGAHSCCTSRRSPSEEPEGDDRLRRGCPTRRRAPPNRRSGRCRSRPTPPCPSLSGSSTSRSTASSRRTSRRCRRSSSRPHRGSDDGPAAPGSGHRARSRPGRRRQEPDHPEERRGRESRSPPIFFSQTPAILVNIDGDSHLEPDQGERPQVRRQYELGSLPARADEDVLPPQQRCVAEGDGLEGDVGAGRHAAGELSRNCPPTTTGRTSGPTSREEGQSRRRSS